MPVAYDLQFTFRDAKAQTSRMKIHVPSTSTIANLQSFVSAIAADLDAITDGLLVSAEVNIKIALPGGLKASPVAGCDVEMGALFSYRDSLGLTTRTRVPTFKQSLVIPTSRAVDTANANVTNFNNKMISGNSTILPCSRVENDITALISAKEQYVKSRNVA
jgi:hypothetical protein